MTKHLRIPIAPWLVKDIDRLIAWLEGYKAAGGRIPGMYVVKDIRESYEIESTREGIAAKRKLEQTQGLDPKAEEKYDD